MKPTLLALALLAGPGLLLPGAASAQVGGACGLTSPPASSAAKRIGPFYQFESSRLSRSVDVHVHVALDRDGFAQAQGAAHIKDGTSNTVLVAERVPAHASCADLDGDGLAGLILVRFTMTDVGSGELVPVSILPDSGEIDENEPQPVTIVVGDSTASGSVRPRFVTFFDK